MNAPVLKEYVGKTVCVMVAIPMVFVVVYPLAYLMMSDYMAIRADLIQDLTILLIVDAVVVPLAGVWLYVRARRQAEAAARGEYSAQENTRDMY